MLGTRAVSNAVCTYGIAVVPLGVVAAEDVADGILALAPGSFFARNRS